MHPVLLNELHDCILVARNCYFSYYDKRRLTYKSKVSTNEALIVKQTISLTGVIC